MTRSDSETKERISGGRDFVMDILKASEEEMERRYRLKAGGYDLERLTRQAAEIFGLRIKVVRYHPAQTSPSRPTGSEKGSQKRGQKRGQVCS